MISSNFKIMSDKIRPYFKWPGVGIIARYNRLPPSFRILSSSCLCSDEVTPKEPGDSSMLPDPPSKKVFEYLVYFYIFN